MEKTVPKSFLPSEAPVPLGSGVAEMRSLLRGGEVSAVGLARACLDRIQELNPALNAVVRVREQALKDAEACDRAGYANSPPLWGIPVIIKDNLAIEGQEVTACSRILSGFVCPYTATAVKRLRSAGAVVIAQSNMDEFAMGSSTEHSCRGPSRNPLDTRRVAGGSSGGSAAAVASRMAPLALGSDTGGSIRQPASFCGVVGLKPSYGRVSRYGLFAYGSSLDQIGPFAGSVEDAAALLEAIEGPDPLDATSSPSLSPLRPFDGPVAGLRIGVPREFMDCSRGLRKEVKLLLEGVLAKLAAEGAELREVSLPILDHVIATYYLIANSEAGSNLSRYDSIRFGLRCDSPENLEQSYSRTRAAGFGEEVRRRILLGAFALSAGYRDAYYKKADSLRREMCSRFSALLEEVDVIMGPTAPDIAFLVGEKTGDPLSMYMQDLYTTFVNLVYAPAISVPCGTVAGLPVGMQVVGRRFDERSVLRAARAVELVRE